MRVKVKVSGRRSRKSVVGCAGSQSHSTRWRSSSPGRSACFTLGRYHSLSSEVYFSSRGWSRCLRRERRVCRSLSLQSKRSCCRRSKPSAVTAPHAPPARRQDEQRRGTCRGRKREAGESLGTRGQCLRWPTFISILHSLSSSLLCLPSFLRSLVFFSAVAPAPSDQLHTHAARSPPPARSSAEPPRDSRHT